MLNLRYCYNLNYDYSKIKTISIYVKQLKYFIPLIQKYPNIINIDLKNNNILGYEHYIIDLLNKTNIKSINLSNMINDNNILPLLYIIGKGIKNNTTLKKLYLINAENLYFENIKTELNNKYKIDDIEKKNDEKIEQSYNILINRNMLMKRYNILYNEFFEGLNLSSIDYLNLSNNNINENFLNILCKNLIQNNTLEYLILNNNKISNIEGINNLLKNNKTLKGLSLINNKIRNLNGIDDALKKNNTLITLYLSKNPIGDITYLCEGLRKNKSLENIHLEECDISNICCFKDTLKQNNTLKYIRLKNNKIKSIYNFCEGLYCNNTLTYLNLGFNNITYTNKLGFILNTNTSIKYLILENNSINNMDVLFQSLYTNTTLTYLDISYNNIKNINDLGRALKMNTSLLHLNINNNKFDYIKPISDALVINSSLISLQLGFKYEYYKEKKILLQEIEKQYIHKDLLDFNNLITALKVNKGLLSLNLNGDHSPGISKLYEIVKYNSTLEELQLLNCNNDFLNTTYFETAINNNFLNALENNYTLTSILF